ncbi:MAG: shikimate dehydrogenase, partial [Desulfobacterales bacterium]|nr:shikimate dehydrogenase [Desulfobacterales bacterium]
MQIHGSTEIYGIIGNPVAHSLSPAMHNSAFGALGLNKVYVPFPAVDVEKALDACRTLNVRGLSVTIPHKETILAHINSIDPVAEKIGAVNTLVFDEENKIHGLNTDWIGANRALADKLDLKG